MTSELGSLLVTLPRVTVFIGGFALWAGRLHAIAFEGTGRPGYLPMMEEEV